MLDPVRLHAVLDLLGHPITYSKGGFDDATDWTARVVLPIVVAYAEMNETAYVRPGGERLIEKTQKAQHADRAVFDALAQVLVDHPRHPLGSKASEIEDEIRTAFETIEPQEA